MTRPYQGFHAACIQHETITTGPGDLIISLQDAALLRDPSGREMTLRPAGAILYVEAALSLSEAVRRHLKTGGLSSNFRFGLAVGLGLYTIQNRLADDVDPAVLDRWIENVAVVSVRPYLLDVQPPEPRTGLFNDALARFARAHGTGLARD